MMQKAAILFNPASGRRRARRVAVVDAVQATLRNAGVETSLRQTTSHEQAIEETAAAVKSGCDTVVACGGDGTIHAVIQGLAGTSAQLAVIPLGTANALAHDLRIPLHPTRAALAALRSQPIRVALGRISYLDFNQARACRYFTVAAGVGVDAHLFYALSAGLKQKMGMAAYYFKAWHLWMAHRMLHFQAEFTDETSAQRRSAEITQLLAVRIRNFGGVLRELAAGADLRRDDLRLVLCKTERRSVYISYVLRALMGGKWEIPEVELAYSRLISCESTARVYVEADGELLGTPPVELSTVPDALTILVPE